MKCVVGHVITGTCKTFCRTCYTIKNYRDRRKKGLPAWRAAGLQNYRGMCEAKNRANRRYRLKNPESDKNVSKRYRDKMRELYGADPRQNSAARLRWLIDKESIKQTGIMPTGVNTLNALSGRKGRCDNIHQAADLTPVEMISKGA